ncbi:hypothetical protein SDC9_71615 [bioreactor metagenome]|uniref:YlbF family regulator n=1 Tax=bioreactor metagenome TaxID=1076179 RepID=A0A644Y998_9ZZZZ|nr:YlbF family regulator [Candidatus Metalachnospira sp.]
MVEDTARRLAEELIKSEYAQKLIAAKKAYDEDLEAQNMVQEYIDMQNKFQNRLATEDVSEEEKDKFYNDINDLNNTIKARESSGGLYRSESDFNEYMQSVYGIISTAVQNAIVPDGGCSGSCSSCGGCH